MSISFPSLIITDAEFKLWYPGGRAFICNPMTALGEVIAALEKEYPEGFQINDLKRRITGDSFSGSKILGMYDSGAALDHFRLFTGGRDFFYPSMEEVEQLRLENNITFAPLPFGTSANPPEGQRHPNSPGFCGLNFGKQGKLFQVIYSILYFYSMRGYGIKRCTICGKWFAVRKSAAQERFCSRPFQYCDFEGKEKNYMTCKEAREGIMQRCIMRRAKIYNRLSPFAQTGGKTAKAFEDFYNTCEDWKDTIRENPSIENLRGYEKYLYVDCSSLDKKYGRQ